MRVLDDRSSNGTFVNGRAVTVAYLTDGDVLRFGRVVFRYVEIEAGASSPRCGGRPRPGPPSPRPVVPAAGAAA